MVGFDEAFLVRWSLSNPQFLLLPVDSTEALLRHQGCI